MLYHLKYREIIKALIYIFIPRQKVIKTFIGSKREINVIGFEPIFKPIVNKVLKNHPAFNAGVQKNDIILEIDGEKTSNIQEVIAKVKTNAKKELVFLIERNESIINLNLIPKALMNASGEEIGIIGVQFSRERRGNFFQSIQEVLKNFIL